MKDDTECLQTIRRLVKNLGPSESAGFTRHDPITPEIDAEEMVRDFPKDRNRPYDVHKVIQGVVDAETFIEYKKGYGQTLVTGYARIDGWSVGIVANQRKVVKSKQGEMQIGGVIYSDSADKASRFIMNCNQKKIPIIFLQDVTGFMIGKRSEHGGIIKDGAKMVNAVANSTVPKITIIMGNSYGAGNYAMCGKAYDPRFIYAWPTAQIAVMGGTQAAKVLTQIKVSSLEKKGKEISEKDRTDLLDKIKSRYDTQTDVRYAAARLWVDGIIDPADTRMKISRAIEDANHNPDIAEFKTGVMQV
jgi:acetyl-CoA carboxylase carboxyltransferase component